MNTSKNIVQGGDLKISPSFKPSIDCPLSKGNQAATPKIERTNGTRLKVNSVLDREPINFES